MKRFALAVGLCIAAAGLVGVPPALSASTLVAEDLPTVETVFNNSVKAVGGRAALDKIKTLHTVMTMNAQGQDVEMDGCWSRKGGRLTTMKMAMGEMSMGSDGTTAWMKNPMGAYSIAPENMKGQLKMAAMLMTVVDPTTMEKEELAQVKVLAKETFQGKACYKLSSPKTKSDEASFMFFDAESGLPVGSLQENGKGSMVFGDWKKVEGVMFFHSMKMEGMGKRGDGNGELKVTTIEVNKPDESAFALPDEVKKLATEKKSDAAAPEIKLSDLSKEDQKEAEQMMQGLGSMDVKMLKQMESSMGMGIDHMPPDKKQLMKFYLQEIKKEIAKRG
jgi:hypothetical protein